MRVPVVQEIAAVANFWNHVSIVLMLRIYFLPFTHWFVISEMTAMQLFIISLSKLKKKVQLMNHFIK